MLGIPTHLAPRVNAWSTVRAFHAGAIGSLVAAAIALLLYRLSEPDVHVISAVLALVPMLGMIGVHVQFGTWRSAVAFLVVGGVCAWWFAMVVQQQVPLGWVTSYLLSLAVIPLILVGGAGAVPSRVVLWSFLGFLTGRVATWIAVVQADSPPRPLVLAWVTLGFVVVLVLFTSRSTGRSERVQPELLRSAREEHVSAYRAGVEAEAAAILHDTVLNHLNAIALAPDGPMDPHLARTVEADVAVLTGKGWLAPAARQRPGAALDAFAVMVDEHRAAGLDVTVSGDPSALDRLDQRAVTALVRAVGQCLANVHKHAGVDAAEVSVFDDGASCTVMVVDDGRGFDEDSTGSDRMGLRGSVRDRIGRVGGDVQIWSSPGSGTSVMMTVPFGPVTATTDAVATDHVGTAVPDEVGGVQGADR
ncbi:MULTISPECIES: sensor histidine kinase [unclassified Curtobacterium]|uniref:sensor histidine kinase n=1 Tax=unclassified Curtobacterium TaxID=257496 RepID=UPI000F49E3E5|nr:MULTISPECIES: ATP-binding protein [unclassified Curtobacterium]ROQ06975.1 signal transduction histidine kinase [Curtobacterium sp. PhB171]ROQ27901.1 signal transduction histidine kinase [Curtobacterium sp. PhB170]ROS34831.1 signal transduction histidine kinase [Curtobacterium sp. PhB131]ROS72802.1 signal transduction histidine kinase [Curtobacterium sp. PhB141]